jgi:polar amino acid transport system substrate-binding protein
MRKIKKSILLLVTVILCLGAVGCGSSGNKDNDSKSTKSDTSWTDVQKKGEMVVAMCPEYPPFSMRDKNGDVEGFNVDFAKALSKELEIEVTFKDTPWEGLVAGLQKGDHDMIISAMSPQEATQASDNVSMSDPYYKLSDIIVVNSKNTDITSKEDIEGKIIGVQASTSSDVAAEELANKGFKVKEIRKFNRTPEAILDLQNERVDAVIVGYAYAVSQLNGSQDFKIVNDPVQVCDLVVVMNGGDDELTKKVNEAMKAIKDNGTYDNCVEKWLEMK